MYTLIVFLLVLSILVFVHEIGHFFTARKFGVRAEEFGFGYPPRAFGIYKSESGRWKRVVGNREVRDASDTIYSINWIPVGGFVKIKGEDGPEVFEGRAGEAALSGADCRSDKDSLVCKPIWQRAIIMSSGVAMNIVLAVFLFSLGLMIGLPQAIEGISDKAEISDARIQIVQVLPETPAAKAGLKMGDIILNIDDKQFLKEEEISAYTADHVGKELKYLILRGDEEVSLAVTPEVLESTGEGGVGVAISATALVRFPWYLAIWEGIKATFNLTIFIIVAFAQLIWGLLTGQGMMAEVAGPVGIAGLTGQYARLGIAYLIQFTALLSINLAVINFLPFPALDGGHVLFLAIEKIKGSPVRRELAQKIHGAGFALLMLLVLLVTVREVIGLF